ncbi:hypothetical protein [Antarcticirhabdus aurantiaca]|uniref:Uncharacterized protein n=1 Tax=Antarcticirhabdus aurantiaca TaxID=2606717 RepID=A0ACD4NUW2_9HYPH|nr:hypothetical protein [Antarcticirhabdus aurantiaca]WAJ30372.1 hypothetical protein OXU80_09275 [Jeongeuplla avenae]
MTPIHHRVILPVFVSFLPMINACEAENAFRVDADGLSWGFLARRSYAEEVTKLLWNGVNLMAADMPAGSNLTPPALDEVIELVEATLFPNVEACRRSDDRKRELMEVFDAMRSALRELNGWAPDL